MKVKNNGHDLLGVYTCQGIEFRVVQISLFENKPDKIKFQYKDKSGFVELTVACTREDVLLAVLGIIAKENL